MSEVLIAIASTGPGALIITGIVVGLLVFLVPLFLPETHGWQDVEKRVVVTDWGISIAAFLIGLGCILVESHWFGIGPSYSTRYRYGISFFFFAIAGQRIYSRAVS